MSKNNVVYLKTFFNNDNVIVGYYIGITNNYKRRMKQHIYISKSNNELPLYRAIRKYKHTTKIIFESDDYNDVIHMEKFFIKKYRNICKILNSVKIYNITSGGQGAGHGEFHFRSKNIEYYKDSEVTRSNFKRTCMSMGWNYDEFIEVYNGNLLGSNKAYNYYYKNNISYEDTEAINIKIKEYNKKEYNLKYNRFKTKTSSRHNFIRYCNRNNIPYYEFVENYSGLVDSNNSKLNYYIHDPEKSSILNKIKKHRECNKIKESTRQNFKKYCIKNNLDFHEFDEHHIRTINGKTKIYMYLYKPDNCESRKLEYDKRNRYSNVGTTRSSFRRYCNNNNLNIEDFTQTDSGFRSKSGNILFLYKLKN